MKKSEGRVIVLEDEPNSLIVQKTVKALEAYYDVKVLEVSESSDEDQVVAECQRQHPVGLVVDYRLGKRASRKSRSQHHVLNGLDIARRVVSKTPCPVSFLTRYPQDHAPRLEFDPRVPVRQFTKPGHGQEAQAESDQIAQELAEELGRRIGERPTGSPRVAVPAMAMSLREFDELDHDKQVSRLAELREAVGSACDDCFVDPDIGYVVVVGPDLLITKVGRVSDGVGPGGYATPPTEASLRLIGRQYGCVPLVIMRPGDLRLIECGRQSKDSDWFPTMRVESSGKGFELPVDSGSTYSIMCDVYARDRKLVGKPPSSLAYLPFELKTARGQSFILMARAHELPALLPAAGGGQVQAKWPLLTAANYVERGLARFCDPSTTCDLSAARGTRPLCGVWLGILGRDLFSNNKLKAVIDFPERQTWVES